MPREGKTNLTIRPSTYSFAKNNKEAYNSSDETTERITWSDIIEAGAVDIVDRGYVHNPVTDTSSDPADSKSIEVDEDAFNTATQRKEGYHSRATWDDVVVAGIRRITGSGDGDESGSSPSREDIEEIVDERIKAHLAPIKQELRALNEQLEQRSDGGGGISEERARELVVSMLDDRVVSGAIDPKYR